MSRARILVLSMWGGEILFRSLSNVKNMRSSPGGDGETFKSTKQKGHDLASSGFVSHHHAFLTGGGGVVGVVSPSVDVDDEGWSTFGTNKPWGGLGRAGLQA